MTILTAPQRASSTAGRRWPGLVTGCCAVLGALGLLAEYGFYAPPVSLAWCRAAEAAALTTFLIRRALDVSYSAAAVAYLRRYWPDLALLPAAAIASAAWGRMSLVTVLQAGAIYVAIRQAGQVLLALGRRAADSVVDPASRARPLRLMLAFYLVLILMGGLLLALPAATTADHRNAPFTHLLNSGFTATSAVCTTGLSVYQVSRDYTPFGKIVILALVQLGGLGMLVFGTLLGMLLVRRWSGAPEGQAQWNVARARRIVGAIAVATLALEAVGAVLLYLLGPQAEPLPRAFHAVFHAVGAFCNSGFTLRTGGLIGRSNLAYVFSVILPLSMLGALGVPVLHDIACRFRRIHRSVCPAAKLRSRGLYGRACPSPRPLDESATLLPRPKGCGSMNTRLAIATALCLAAAGTLGFLLFEMPASVGYWYVGKTNLLSQQESVQLSPEWMRSHEGSQRLLDAVFLATAAPAAGLKTVPIESGAMSPASQVLLMLLMLVGGAPASTAGGLKTVAFAVLVLYVLSILRRRRHTEVFGRQIPDDGVRRVLALFFVAAAWLTMAVVILAHTERASFLAVLFEAVSALSTSGLSLGLTPALTALGKGVILLTMLVGRLGPLTLVIALAGDESPGRQDGHEEPILPG